MDLPAGEQQSRPRPASQSSTLKIHYAWRTEPEINAERQKELSQCFEIKPDIQHGIYPLKDIKLTRADIEWLLANHERGRGPANWGDERQRERLGIDLRGADLRKVNLRNLPLTRIRGGLNWDQWRRATLEEREMAAVHLERANLNNVHLEGAILQGAHLEETDLRDAHLEGAKLYGAYLQNAYLRDAHLEEARLGDTHFEGARLANAHLEGTDLRGAFLDGGTDLVGVSLGNEKFGYALLADVHWSDANLSLVNWTSARKLGDENEARHRERHWGKQTAKEKAGRLDDYQTAARAYRQIANAMRAQGMNTEADPFAYRAQVLQRKVFWRQVLWGQVESLRNNTQQKAVWGQVQDFGWRVQKLGSLVFSWILFLLAGYGYRPWRSIVAYLVIIFSFMGLYLLNAHFIAPHLGWDEALVLSVSSFHGRGFFSQSITLGDTYARLAAAEAVVGLFIEISFIATFTQRFFGR